MAMSIPVEAVEKGDRLVLWFANAPRAVVVRDISVGMAVRTFQVSHEGSSVELSVQHGHTVDLTC
ncbi:MULTISPECIES: hypothetical protein [Pseudomonas]|uniref:Uncharacterized protein n=1 Tax=Pseudomonas fluorescens TaxID=294 RepID=A0A166QLK7_PSEFL|nr:MULTISPECIES: hypothetical protein [Pseudomonas]KZN20475.1 hypothetical protein A1D17_02735 [Pseudomonas fluorescens]